MKPVGILGGTFDPVHNGHLRLAIEFYEQLELAEVRLIPLRIPPHRDDPVATPEQRLAMLNIATKNIPGLTVDGSELSKEKVSYTIETVTFLREKLGETPICLLMGTDAFTMLHSWHRWQELLDYVHIVIAGRPVNGQTEKNNDVNSLLEKNLTTDSGELHHLPAGKVYKLVIPMLEISATRIRNIITSKMNADGLLPDNVLEFIIKNNLYKAGT